MGLVYFGTKAADGCTVDIPQAYRRTVKWLPKIGDIFPAFAVDTTQGHLNFWDWAEGSWVFLFSHPAACTPVCTTELGTLAAYGDDFKKLGVKALGITGSSVNEQLYWHADIEKLYDAPIWFPTAEDPGGQLASMFGMCHEKEHETQPIRKSFVLDPQMRIRMIFEYPIYVGRSIEETMRVISALQENERTGAAIPADWCDGDPVIVLDGTAETDVAREFHARSKYLLPYLRMVKRFRPKPGTDTAA